MILNDGCLMFLDFNFKKFILCVFSLLEGFVFVGYSFLLVFGLLRKRFYFNLV